MTIYAHSKYAPGNHDLADTKMLHAYPGRPLVSEPWNAFRLNLADATSNQDIEQQLADPWSDTQVWDAFQETLAGWKAETRPKRMTGGMPALHPGLHFQTMSCWLMLC